MFEESLKHYTQNLWQNSLTQNMHVPQAMSVLTESTSITHKLTCTHLPKHTCSTGHSSVWRVHETLHMKFTTQNSLTQNLYVPQAMSMLKDSIKHHTQVNHTLTKVDMFYRPFRCLKSPLNITDSWTTHMLWPMPATTWAWHTWRMVTHSRACFTCRSIWRWAKVTVSDSLAAFSLCISLSLSLSLSVVIVKVLVLSLFFVCLFCLYMSFSPL